MPRFITKTHTDALRPLNYSLLVAKCTYGDQRSSPEVVSKRLQKWLDKSVSKFTVLLSTEKNRGFGFLSDKMIWSWKGYVVNTTLAFLDKTKCENIEDFQRLTNFERICYLRYFLETDGAIFLKFAVIYQKKGTLSYLHLKENIQGIFKEILSDYLDIATDLRARSRIRENQGQMKFKERYDNGTLPHKIKPHIQALEDLGILASRATGNDLMFDSTVIRERSTLLALLESLKDVKTMESRFANYEYFEIVADIYGLTPITYSSEAHRSLLVENISYGYQTMCNKTTGMADLEAIYDWACISMLARHNVLVSRNHLESFFKNVRKEFPGKITYHVDGKGRIAYLVLNQPL
jgi:hypothetical protein